MSLEQDVGELKGLMQAVRTDVASLKNSVEGLKTAQDQQRGGGKVLVGVGAFIGAVASMAVEALKR